MTGSPDDALFQENERTQSQNGYELAAIGSLKLATGRALDSVQVAYQTWGTLNADRSNAVLICHALSGNANAVGWWDRLIGPWKAIDTTRYFVVGTNALGGCNGTTGPASVAPDGNRYGSRFPVIQVSDMVDAQASLADQLGIKTWLMVAGGSMGGMQALEWSVRYPERVKKVWMTASCRTHSAMQIGFNETARQAIMRDPKWKKGDYDPTDAPLDGLSVARMVGHLSYLSEASFEHKFGRKLQSKDAPSFDLGIEYQVESYLSYQGDKFGQRFDPASLVYLMRAIDYYQCDSLEGSQADYLFTSFTSDWLYPTWQSAELNQMALKAGRSSQHHEIDLPWGHDAFLLDDKHQTRLVVAFLDSD